MPAALWRLVWKDTRTLLPAWLAVFGMAIAMQLLLVVNAAVFNEPPVTMAAMATVAACLCIPLAIASGAMQFAGETEAGTDEWLRQLPIRPWLLGTQKLITSLIANAIYFGAALGSAFLLTGGRQRGYDDALIVDAIGLAISLFAWCTFFSLLRRRVVPAVALGIFVGVFLPPLIYFGLLDIELFEFAGTNLVIGMIVLCLDCAIAVRWGKGRIPALRGLESANLPRVNRLWQPLLERSVARRDSVLRTFCTLLWKESRSGLSFIIWWSIAGAAIAFAGVPVFFILLTPLAAGFVAFAGDHSRESQQFLGHRGIAPSLVWLSRNVVWLLTAVALMLGWSLLDHYKLQAGVQPVGDQFHLNEASVFWIADAIRLHYPDSFPYGPASAADRLYQISCVGSIVLGLFALGMMCGMWFRRGIVGAAVAFAGFISLWIWHAAMLKAAVPLWLTTWPLAIAWLAATWRGSDRWLVGRTQWKRQSVWMFLPGVFVLAMFPITRYRQIPQVDVSLDETEARWMEYNEEQSRMWDQFADSAIGMRLKYLGDIPWSEADSLAMTELLHDAATSEPRGRWALSPELWIASEDALAAAFHFAEGRGAELREQGRLAEEIDLYVDALLLMDRVEPLWPDEVWYRRFYQLRFLTFITDWANSPGQNPQLLQHALGRLSTEYHFIRPEEFSLTTTATENYAVILRQVMRQEGLLYDNLRHNPYRKTDISFEDYYEVSRPASWLRRVYDWTGETARYEKLLAAIVADARLSEFERRYRGAIVREGTQPTVPFDRADLDRWIRATPVFVAGNHYFVPLEEIVLRNRQPMLPLRSEETQGTWEESRLLNDERELFTAYYLTVLTIALQHHRHEHGEFPEHLSQLAGFHPQMLELVTTDQFSRLSRHDFHWCPHGLPGPLFLDERVIYAKQPLLFSVGRDQRFLEFESLDHRLEDWIDAGDSSRVAYFDGTRESGERFASSLSLRPEPPLVPFILNYPDGPADEVATAILGESARPRAPQRRWRSPDDELND